MEFHQGRLIDHVDLRVADLARSRRFYEAVLRAVGRGITHQGESFLASDELYVSTGEGPPSHVHLAFQAKDRDTVKRFHEAGLAAGGENNGVPGERKYHPGYFAAFLFDPDGNNIEAVFHGPSTRSSDSVVVTAK
jgi:catechol 2,3-dioxygenase-like lactoylglutathione lyase family enzyme